MPPLRDEARHHCTLARCWARAQQCQVTLIKYRQSELDTDMPSILLDTESPESTPSSSIGGHSCIVRRRDLNPSSHDCNATLSAELPPGAEVLMDAGHAWTRSPVILKR